MLKQTLVKLGHKLRLSLAKTSNEKLLYAISQLDSGGNGITLIDIGAAGEIQPRWRKIEPIINYVGFEPDARSRELLLSKKTACASYNIFPTVVSNSGGKTILNLCRKPQVSSIYSPNKKLIDLFPDPTRFDVLSTVSLETSTLDNLNIEKADFIKIDIQGGELNALIGGEGLLKKTLGLELEVEFIELYESQPLFGEVCAYLSKNGFDFIDFLTLYRWERKAHNGYGQCTFGDALFLRSPENMMTIDANSEAINNYLTICLIYNRFDLIDRLMSLLINKQTRAHDNFIKAIEPIRNRIKRVRYLVKIFNSFLLFFGIEFYAHLIN